MSTQTIYLEPSQIPAAIRSGYTGKRFRAIVCESVFIPSHAGLWDGGSRTTFEAIHLSSGETRAASDNMSAPWDNARKDQRIALRDGFAIISHSIFQGKDMGLTIYLHPNNAVAILPPSIELNPLERLVLEYTMGRKASYNGRDRFDMLLDDLSYSKDRKGLESTPTRDHWNAAKDSLIAQGFLNARGAITNKGRNAIG
jgi:hypothetical protein